MPCREAEELTGMKHQRVSDLGKKLSAGGREAAVLTGCCRRIKNDGGQYLRVCCRVSSGTNACENIL
jgi:hypothetical protein